LAGSSHFLPLWVSWVPMPVPRFGPPYAVRTAGDRWFLVTQ